MNCLISESKECKNCKVAMCSKNCPLNMDIPLICSLVNENKLDDASNVLFNYNPFGYVTSILCDHDKQCAGNCVFKAVNFYKIEHELSTKYFEKLINYPTNLKNSNVVIVGGGIAGLTVAHTLLKNGFTCTIYEKNKLGGIIETSIPSFRFDNVYLKKHIKKIESLVKVIHEEVNELSINQLKKYRHVVFATGAPMQNVSLNSDKLIKGIDILEEAKNGNSKIVNKKVLVIGLGNTACDVARTLKRFDNDVTIVYRRDIDSSPASLKELNELKEEGINFEFQLSPIEIKSNSLLCRVNELVEVPGKKRKDIRETEELRSIYADYVVDATGSKVDDTLLKMFMKNEFKDYEMFKRENPNAKFYFSKTYSVCGDGYYGAWNIAHAVNSGLGVSKKLVPNYLFGGSFNPITNAHVAILNNVSKLGKVIVVPNGDNYNLKDLASFEQRVKMIELETRDNDNIIISDLEHKRPFKGTIETLRYFNHPIMVIGDDCLVGLGSWINAKKLISENKFLVLCRNYSIDEIKNLIKQDELLSNYENNFEIRDILTDDEKKISSTDFRNNKNFDNISKNIKKYIEENKLYEV